jgi:hypothetical protein
MTSEEKYAWMRQKQSQRKAATALKAAREKAEAVLESEAAKAKAKAVVEREAAKAQAALEREADTAKAVVVRESATVETSCVVIGFTWGTPLPPRTRDQVKRACAWHKRRKNDATRVKCACGECEVCRLRARNAKNLRRWRAAKREAV